MRNLGESEGQALLDAAGITFDYHAYTSLFESATETYAPEVMEVFELLQTHPYLFAQYV